MQHSTDHRSLWYFVPDDHEFTPPSRVNVPITHTIDDLKKAVNEERLHLVLSGIPNMLLLKVGYPGPPGYTRLFIEGTMGYGKSHILAALACMLYRQGKRVVFVPDCRAMIRDPLLYIKSALLCAFAGPSESLKKERDRIRACSTMEKIHTIFHGRSDGPIPYFIVDQINPFEHSNVNTDLIQNGEKTNCNEFIMKLTCGRFLITSASANYETSKHMERKQTGDRKMSAKGGMTNNEMEQWWHHYRTKLPKFGSDEEKAMVRDLTGGIPLLLRPFLSLGQQNFCDVEDRFRSSSEIITVGTNIMEFAGEMMGKGEWEYNSYINNLFKCITHSGTLVNTGRSFDYRYFHRTENRFGACTCGLAREAATTVIAQNKPEKLYSPEWISNLRLLKDKPSALGVLVELTCLSCVADFGLHYGELHLDYPHILRRRSRCPFKPISRIRRQLLRILHSPKPTIRGHQRGICPLRQKIEYCNCGTNPSYHQQTPSRF